jgi:vitamin K-dependent gamma-carboxylase
MPVCAASVAAFRIAFGVAVAVNACFFLPGIGRRHYIEPSFHFSYGPLTMIEPLPGEAMYLPYLAMIVTGILIALGRWYRFAISAFFVVTTYVFLLDPTFYQNHEYLIALVAFLMIFLPMNRYWSLDAAARPEIRATTVPAWVVWLLRFQIGVPYFFGGLAKLNADWLHGEPLRTWLAARTDVEPLHSILTISEVAWAATYGSLLLDLLAVPLLLWKRTRVGMFIALAIFHLINVWLFGLYIFPWLMIAATTIYFEPTWPQDLWARVGQGKATEVAGLATEAVAPPRTPRWRSVVVTVALAVWIAAQVVVPLRHYAIPGNSSWTEEGHYFAWHMMLRQKSGSVTFVVSDGDRTWRIDPRDHLTDDQARELPWYPQHLVQFAHYLADLHPGAEVRAETLVSLNGRPYQPIVDAEVDLASIDPSWWGHEEWIVPLEN